MGALTTALIAVAGIAFGWISIELACKPCLETGRQAIDRNLNPDYDPDDDNDVRATLNPNQSQVSDASSSSSTEKAV